MLVITATQPLADACQRLAKHDFVAVDTEFMREQTFWPKLCLVQLAAPGLELVVDPLAPGIDLAPFFALMADQRVMKVFHAARQDIEIVHYRAGIVPKPVFDTQVAAMVCGYGDSISYVNLVKRINNQDLDKSSRFTDWSRRPLSEKQLVYALGDVTHLRDVYVHLRDTLEKTGRASWLDQEMAGLTDPRTYEVDPETSWKRLKLKVRNRRGPFPQCRQQRVRRQQVVHHDQFAIQVIEDVGGRDVREGAVLGVGEDAAYHLQDVVEHHAQGRLEDDWLPRPVPKLFHRNCQLPWPQVCG